MRAKLKKYGLSILIGIFIVTTTTSGLFTGGTRKVYAEDVSIPVTAVDTDGHVFPDAVIFTGTDITKATAPKISDKVFVRAYVKDSVSNQPYEIDSLYEKNGRIYFTHKGENREEMTLERSYKKSEAQSKIFFEYYNSGKTVQITYRPDSVDANNEKPDIVVHGPTDIAVGDDGYAEGYFTVSVPRDHNPKVDAGLSPLVDADNPTDISFAKKNLDGTITTRTVYRYKIRTNRDLNINISSIKKARLVAVADSTRPTDDWMFGFKSVDYKPTPADGEVEIYKAYRDKNNVLRYWRYWKTQIVTQNITDRQIDAGIGSYGGTTTDNFSYGNTIHFRAYIDRALYRKYAGMSSTYLGAVWLNGQPFGAPQPFSRYGISRYPKEQEGGNSNRRSKYDGAWSSWSVRGYRPSGGAGFLDAIKNQDLRAPLISTFTFDEGWDSYHQASWGAHDSERNYQTYYKNVIQAYVLGATSTTFVTEGPLAGATITIKIMDAKPPSYFGNLRSWEYDSNGNITTDPHDMSGQYQNFATNTSGDYGNWDQARSGANNQMRLAYDIQIDNAPTDITAMTEWTNGNDSKTGMYLNYGVENVGVNVTNFYNMTDRDAIHSSATPTLYKADYGWFTNGDLGAKSTPRVHDKFSKETLDPNLGIQADVKNGYTNPKFYDQAFITGIHNSWFDPDPDPGPTGSHNKPLTKNPNGGDGIPGVQGTYPLFAKVISSIEYNNDSPYFIKTGGMNIVGIKAELMHIPLDYQLDGGSVTDANVFPDKANSLSPGKELYLLDVEGNPSHTVDIDIPKKDNATFKHWEVIPMKDDQELGTKMILNPGDDFDLLKNEKELGRINKKDGSVNFDTIRLKAVYAENEKFDDHDDAFSVTRVFVEDIKKDGTYSIEKDASGAFTDSNTKGTEVAGYFFSVHGADTNMTPKGEKDYAPEEVSWGGKKWIRLDVEQKRRGEKVQTPNPIGGYETFTETNRTMNVVYVREKRGTVKVRYEYKDGTLMPGTKEIVLKDNVLVGTDYKATQESFEHYDFLKMKDGSAPAQGKVKEGEQTVIFVYKDHWYDVPVTGLNIKKGHLLLLITLGLFTLVAFLLLWKRHRDNSNKELS